MVEETLDNRGPTEAAGSRTPSRRPARMLAAAQLALSARSRNGSWCAEWDDPGPAVLASLVAEGALPRDRRSASVALGRWLDRRGADEVYVDGCGGLAGFYVGARAASSLHPPLTPLAQTLRESIARWSDMRPWRVAAVAWEDYDVVSGPAGLVLALSGDGAAAAKDAFSATRHLVELCEGDALERLRVGAYRYDPHRSWSFGQINTGLAHGVAGVVAALRAALEVTGARAELAPTLARLCRWLVAQSFVDARGLRTWAPTARQGLGSPSGTNRKQAWSHGTPGISWVLWEAGRVLDDVSLRAFAEDAMRSFCAAFDEHVYIDAAPADATLGIYQGAAGLLAVADAFARHAGLPEAQPLAAHLESYVIDRIDLVLDLARADMTLLTGASGILSVLLTRLGGPRTWLTHLALR